MADKSNKTSMSQPKKPNYQVWVILGLMTFIFGISYFSNSNSAIEISFKRFEQMLISNDVKRVLLIGNQKIVEVSLKAEALQNSKYKVQLEQQNRFGMGSTDPHYFFKIASIETFQKKKDTLDARLKSNIEYEYLIDDRSDYTHLFLNSGFFILIIVGFWLLMRRMAGGGGPGGQIFNIGKSKAALFDADNKVKITFDNVAGLDEAKEEVKEIVDFLKTPAKFTALGGKIPKGALLIGAPGTGKTLLAKAVAGEAAVPFFTLSGSDFVEMFVGVGAARVRDLFKQANEKAPCIIFIDEIDAIGRSRGKGQMPGSNDERENTLNSLLVEMDGFSTDSGVIILAATNRPDVLDSALLRPGRFDRQISIDKPDIVGRSAIFKVHLKPIKISKAVNARKLAAQTPGFAGAEIANVCNEAALIAARQDKEEVEVIDFQDAIDRVIGGLEKKTKIISPEEKKIVAYHEAGHAIAGWYLEHTDPLVKVSIVPRGYAALGYAQYLPKEQHLHQTDQLIDEMCMALGGRAAEQLIFGKISTGALSDLERITKIANSIVTVYGMSDVIGNISYYDSKQSEYNFNKPYSEVTARLIDAEVKKIVDDAYQRTFALLTKHKDGLQIIAQALLEKEVIFQNDLEEMLGKRPFENETNYDAFVNEKKQNNPKTENENDIETLKSEIEREDDAEDIKKAPKEN